MFKHQGDIRFCPAKSMPEGEVVKHDGSFILARGEATNHCHRITVADPQKMQIIRLPDGRSFVHITSQASITHEEHMEIILAPGVYEVRREREMDWFSMTTRKVVD